MAEADEDADLRTSSAYTLTNLQPSSLTNASSPAVLIYLDNITPVYENIAPPICSRHIAELIGTAEQSSEDFKTLPGVHADSLTRGVCHESEQRPRDLYTGDRMEARKDLSIDIFHYRKDTSVGSAFQNGIAGGTKTGNV